MTRTKKVKYTNITEKMREFSREKALFRKTFPKDELTGRWTRVLNRVVKPYEKDRDRTLRGKARRDARRAARRMAGQEA